MSVQQVPRPTPVEARWTTCDAYTCTACGFLTRDMHEMGRHILNYAGSLWTGEARPMNRGDGIRHQSAYHWTHGPSFTHRAICDGHPVWIIGGIDLDDCQMCEYVLAHRDPPQGALS